jgi:hypothetical protein
MKNWLEKTKSSNASFMFKDDDIPMMPMSSAAAAPKLNRKIHPEHRMSMIKRDGQSFSRMTLFGMVHIVDDAVKVQRMPSRFMLHPYSTFISYWYFVTIMLLLYIFISVPVMHFFFNFFFFFNPRPLTPVFLRCF